jgi:hypothetical protein
MRGLVPSFSAQSLVDAVFWGQLLVRTVSLLVGGKLPLPLSLVLAVSVVVPLTGTLLTPPQSYLSSIRLAVRTPKHSQSRPRRSPSSEDSSELICPEEGKRRRGGAK